MFARQLSIGLILACLTPPCLAERDWPFVPVEPIDPPSVSNSGWIRNDLDRFILAKLDAAKLSPAATASRETLLRRLTFDLIGLPPTPAEVQEFINDRDRQAYEKVVDRLLADKRYGEHWARYWLDLARYADTAGYEGDPDLPHAWRYRDYVIDALNNDKPYDLFIREQIAGDEFSAVMGAGELPIPPAERIVAMTFLRLAPFTEPRGDETRHEMLSEITSTVGSVFLGLTVGCAKCHDHKHDEIPTADFYRMKAFFSTIQIPPPARGDGFQIGGSIKAEFYRPGEKDWAANLAGKLRQQAATAKDELANLKTSISDRLEVSSTAATGFGIQTIIGGNDYFFERRAVNDGKPHLSIVNADGNKWAVYTDGEPSSLGSLSGSNRAQWFGDLSQAEYVALGQHTAGTGSATGSGRHLGHFAEILVYDHPLDETERDQLTRFVRQKYQSATDRIEVVPPQEGLRFWLDAEDIDANPESPNPAPGAAVSVWVDKVGHLALRQADAALQPKLTELGENRAAAVHFENSFLRGSVANASFLDNQAGAIVIVYSATHGDEGYGFEVGGGGKFLSTFVNPAAQSGNDPIEKLLSDNDSRITKHERNRYRFLSTRDRYVKQHLKRLEPVAMSLRHSFGPPYEPGVPVSRIMIRGEYDNPGDVVQAGFLSVISGNQDPAPIRLDPFKRWPTRSRRMALANWIASKDNPLTARVMMNRLWYRHFGAGIVRTPSDFGYLSGGPSHPHLLDWLAGKFVEKKWSLKQMHRLIVTSNTYRQKSAVENPLAAKTDPDNRLLWRFNRQRLSAEAIRDSILFVSGRLNPELGGLPIFPPLPDDVAERVKYSESKWDTQHGPEGRKRSIYVYQQRTLTMPFLQTFDSLVCEETRPRRRSSVTPLQALAMYNGDFVNEEATHFASRLAQQPDRNSTADIHYAFQLALGRSPIDREVDALTQLISTADSPAAGLVSLCRVLFNLNEFSYID